MPRTLSYKTAQTACFYYKSCLCSEGSRHLGRAATVASIHGEVEHERMKRRGDEDQKDCDTIEKICVRSVNIYINFKEF